MSEVGAAASTDFFSGNQDSGRRFRIFRKFELKIWNFRRSLKKDVVGTWTAFKWLTGKTDPDAEEQTLTCTIGLSESRNEESVDNCVNS